MDRTEQADYKARLIELRRRLKREVDSTEEALREDVAAPGALSSVPTHPADRDVEGLDAEIAIAQNEEHLLEQVEAALERIESGKFGVCQQCGKPIAKQRLQALPYTPRCIDCARGHDERIERPKRGEPRMLK